VSIDPKSLPGGKPVPLIDLKAQFQPIKEEVLKEFESIFESMYLFLGKNVQALEKEFAEYCDCAHGIGVGSGTDALHLALLACGVKPGDEVITTAYTFIATFEAIAYVGAIPVFVDIDPKTYLMDPSLVERAITPKTKAIIPVHIYGQMVDMDPIMDIARKRGLKVIEDACQAHGATYKGRKAGSIGDAGCFSFYFSKNLGGYGEGGFVTTNDAEINSNVRLLRDHGSPRKYEHDYIGFNARLDELQAAVLRIKLRSLDKWNQLRRAHAGRYNELLANAGVVTPFIDPRGESVYHLYVIRTPQREALREKLIGKQIGVAIHYPIGIHEQVAFRNYSKQQFSLPVTESVCKEVLSLPMYPELSAEQIEYVAACVTNP